MSEGDSVAMDPVLIDDKSIGFDQDSEEFNKSDYDNVVPPVTVLTTQPGRRVHFSGASEDPSIVSKHVYY